jgi:hypothetical protein
MASFFDTFPAGLSKPGAAEFFGNLGAGLMAAGQTAPVGTNRVGLMAPYMQSAIAAPRKAQEQAMMAQLGQMQLAQAQQTQEQAAARKRFVGLMGNPTADPTQVRAGFMEAYPEQAAGGYAKQAFPEKKKPIVVNNRLVDPDTYQPVADFSDKPTGPFSGNAPFAQTYNLLVSYQQKKASNIPTTPEEDSAYGLAYQHALRPERFTLPTGELVERPGAEPCWVPRAWCAEFDGRGCSHADPRRPRHGGGIGAGHPRRYGSGSCEARKADRGAIERCKLRKPHDGERCNHIGP